MGSLCGREKVRPGRFFSRSEKTNKQMLQGREGYQADMINMNPFSTWSVFPCHAPKGQSADTFIRHGRIRSVLYHIRKTYNTRAMMVVMMAVMMVMTLLSVTFFILLFTVYRRSAEIQPQRKSLIVHTKRYANRALLSEKGDSQTKLLKKQN